MFKINFLYTRQFFDYFLILINDLPPEINYQVKIHLGKKIFISI